MMTTRSTSHPSSAPSHPGSDQHHSDRDRTHHADLGDAQLEYWQRGSGPTVLLVHSGLLGDGFAPVYHHPALDGFHVVRTHRAGYGASTSCRSPVSIADHARHCTELLDQLGVLAAHWVGHSSSGAIALQAALDRPDLFTGMTLLESAPYPEGPSGADLGRRVVGPAMMAFAAGDLATATELFMTGVCGPSYADVIRERLGAYAGRVLEHEARTFFSQEGPAAVSWRPEPAALAGIRVPTLLVTGDAGLQITRAHQETTDLLAQILPNARALALPDLGHLMPLEDPAAIASLIADFGRRTQG
jgi:pimeloyl-ACP methyl ester carboxylesterase